MSIYRTMVNLSRRLRRPGTWAAIAAIPVGIISFVAVGGSSPPNIPILQLANGPLYANSTADKPAMALALSVEYPTVGAQYTPGGNIDNTYSNSTEYLGYYDAESCYRYNNSPTETVAPGLSAADYKRFDRIGAATNRKCSDAFSGNFLNWASSSAIDMLRLALSGGDRYIDTSNLTILQRAVLPNGDPVCMWNSNNFPAKQLTRDGGGAGTYWGAVPTALATAAGSNDIWVANTLNRIYFGTSRAGDCNSGPGSYTLGGPAGGNVLENNSPATTTSNLPPDAQRCIAGETGTCSFTGIKQIWYGAGTKWKVVAASEGLRCPQGCNSVLGDPLPGTGKNVYYVTYTGTWRPPATLTSDGFFYARVQVCDSSGTTLNDSRDYNLCRQYPSGSFKPTGAVQRYSEQLRLAAFGYLMDPTASYNNGRYGGVLRAPMKYVGTKTYNEQGQENTPVGGNPAAEWDATTGVFVQNPDNYTNTNASLNFGISGVINYLNKFGRTGPVQGRYKTYDPVGELHYETLRYLQGLGPSADAISNMTTSMYDGYPVYTTWTDPYGGSRSSTADYSCLKSNIVVIGDINTHDGNRLPTPNAANNIIDINGWRSVVQSFEKNITSATYVDGRGTTRPIANPNGANTRVPSASGTSQIMGSAYWAHTHDIRGSDWTGAPTKQRPGLRVKTFLFDVNEYGDQNDTNTRRFANQFFMAAKYGGFETESNANSRPFNTQGNPFKSQAGVRSENLSTDAGVNNNDVWQKSTAPGEASTYYLQSSARGVLNAFEEIFSRAASTASSIAGSAASSTSISTSSGAVIYSAKFDTTNWSGDVVAQTLTVNANRELAVGSGTGSWSAATQLNNMTSPAANRKIYVGQAAATANPKAVAFTWSTIDSTLQAQLNKESPSAATDALGSARLDFLRGDRSREGSPFRRRSVGSILGDIVNSSVVYSGGPSLAYAGTGYTAFVTANASRTKAVFVGANDGMLHAFNAQDGSELFAYIPSWMGPRLSALTSTTYNNNHQSYVDASPVVAEAQVANTGGATDWKTVLVSGTGAGGQGVFALDVTNPANFDGTKALWEFTSNEDADMGYVVGRPQVLKLRTNATGTPTYRWFAVVASGVNNYVKADSAGNYSDGNPTLFLLALDKAVGDAWALGTNYYKVALPIDSTLSSTRATGALNFTPLFGVNKEVTNMYVGDLHGSIWKLNFQGVAASNWSMTNLTAYKNAGGQPAPFFTAKTSAGVRQPITAPPTLFAGPTVRGLPTFYVMVGTGKFLESADTTSTRAESIYALYDTGFSGVVDDAGFIAGRSRLKQGSVDTTALTVTVPAFTWGKAVSDTDSVSPRSGWYVDMPSSGERLISNILNRGSLVAAFNTIVPGSAGNQGTCNSAAGGGNAYTINVGAGSGGYEKSQVGLLGPVMLFDNESAETVTPFDSAGQAIRRSPQSRLNPGQANSAQGSDVVINEIVGRLSWRQINNYQDLKAQ
ncbi:PilC/PilY family type IV pilus protein [Acidovorax sp. PRC11]|uniref:pilus assembly protein n=1 Tax=Acidovorax sp. PRC11 TaxID=2962592 RepID=UPI002882BD9C|nr:PilC/PilY family type IV pilus protein [Acidovorax sp. PRC11]MDT0140068.1 PilC/PilY family type IV pilus protein [Acidovorax sp. PRC11]